MRSHLLEGKVRHRRPRPFTYGLEHDVWYAALDLAELDDARSPGCACSGATAPSSRSATAITCRRRRQTST